MEEAEAVKIMSQYAFGDLTKLMRAAGKRIEQLTQATIKESLTTEEVECTEVKSYNIHNPLSIGCGCNGRNKIVRASFKVDDISVSIHLSIEDGKHKNCINVVGSEMRGGFADFDIHDRWLDAFIDHDVIVKRFEQEAASIEKCLILLNESKRYLGFNP